MHRRPTAPFPGTAPLWWRCSSGGGKTGIGFTYGAASGALLIERIVAPRLPGEDPLQIPKLWQAMVAAVRNVGWPGVAATVASAADIALWDLK